MSLLLLESEEDMREDEFLTERTGFDSADLFPSVDCLTTDTLVVTKIFLTNYLHVKVWRLLYV